MIGRSKLARQVQTLCTTCPCVSTGRGVIVGCGVDVGLGVSVGAGVNVLVGGSSVAGAGSTVCDQPQTARPHARWQSWN